MKALYYLFNYITFPPSPHFTIGRMQVDKGSIWIALSLDKAVKRTWLGSVIKQTNSLYGCTTLQYFKRPRSLDSFQWRIREHYRCLRSRSKTDFNLNLERGTTSLLPACLVVIHLLVIAWGFYHWAVCCFPKGILWYRLLSCDCKGLIRARSSSMEVIHGHSFTCAQEIGRR